MKHHIDIVINVSDPNRVKSIPELYERISGTDELGLVTQFIMAFTRITREIHAKELAEVQKRVVSDDDIPF